MVRSLFLLLLPLCCLIVACLSGCSDAPAPPIRFKLNPQVAAEEALRLYDTNHDGALDAKELENSPPLKELQNNLKHNEPSHGDSLAAQDLTTRFEQWVKGTAVLQDGIAMVFLDGRPLEGATVTFEPEPFLGDSYHSHKGTTDSSGMVTVDPELKDFPGIYVGLYRVKISKIVAGKETIPARYNEKTTLGREVATDIKDARENIMFRLKSR